RREPRQRRSVAVDEIGVVRDVLDDLEARSFERGVPLRTDRACELDEMQPLAGGGNRRRGADRSSAGIDRSGVEKDLCRCLPGVGSARGGAANVQGAEQGESDQLEVSHSVLESVVGERVNYTAAGVAA